MDDSRSLAGRPDAPDLARPMALSSSARIQLHRNYDSTSLSVFALMFLIASRAHGGERGSDGLHERIRHATTRGGLGDT